MNVLPVARAVRENPAEPADDTITLTYDDRFLRRKRLVGDGGLTFLLDLSKTISLNAGDALMLADGRLISVCAAREPLLEVTGPDLPRLAWHIGNRHTPCQIESGRLLIQRDHVIRDMLQLIGATLREVEEPFTPEGGAYGLGRTHGHDHGASHGGHDHAHSHPHDHAH